MELNCFVINKKTPGLAGPQGVLFDMTDGGGMFIARFHAPTEKEINAFKAGSPLEIRFVKLDGVIYLLFKFQGMEWMDAAYSVHLSLNLTHLDVPKDGCGYLMQLVLADTDGTVCALRTVSLSTKFSKAFRKAVVQQLDEPFNPFIYDIKISEAYARYSTKDMVRFSSEYCRIGY